MTAGHLNPGYNRIVTKHALAINNPSGTRAARLNLNQVDLENIRTKSRDVWSEQDTSETTYGYFFRDPAIKDRENLRPTSPTRRNNPHPNK